MTITTKKKLLNYFLLLTKIQKIFDDCLKALEIIPQYGLQPRRSCFVLTVLVVQKPTTKITTVLYDITSASI